VAKRKGNPVPTPHTNKLTTAPADPKPVAFLAQTALRPSLQAAATIRQWKPLVGDVALVALMDELAGQARLASAGNLQRAEAMLVTQAHTLDVIFNNLARRTASAEYLPQFEAYMRLGLKAQSQCRATLETLAAIKNPPPVTFVRQANVAHGPQQVNNAARPVTDASRARESESQPNELLEQQREQWLDGGTTQAAGSADPPVATMEAIHRPPDGERYESHSSQCLEGRHSPDASKAGESS
jgi:hypothetical protein